MFSKKSTGTSGGIAPPTDNGLGSTAIDDENLKQAIRTSLASSRNPTSKSSESITASTNPQPSPTTGIKRTAPEKLASRSLKRSKSGGAAGANASVAVDKGQQSLKGFFKPKSSQADSLSKQSNGERVALVAR